MESCTYIYKLVINCDSEENEIFEIWVDFDSQTMSLAGRYFNCRERVGGHKLIAGSQDIPECEVNQRIEVFAQELSQKAISDIQNDPQSSCDNPQIVSLKLDHQI